ncbi:hypothetical protein SAMN05421578_109140 [Paenibacillus macquariensis]|uniref:Uncharacterized protein n=1 Tax=Paenibacillus macquariensis TaxID=948756 RepID=A0ABY1K4M3_9BACL|nr:hypothetical protein SAMN05421578_109140 [Paenibacillus macquariensis]
MYPELTSFSIYSNEKSDSESLCVILNDELYNIPEIPIPSRMSIRAI